MSQTSMNRFKDLTFEGFRKLADDESLSRFEKIGFPDSYRSGRESMIFQDVRSKLRNLDAPSQIVLDIGPGCSDLPRLLIEHCRKHEHQLILIDSPEMLRQLPDGPFIQKISGRFPSETFEALSSFQGRINSILSYSVLHYIFAEGGVFPFLDSSLQLLAEGGEMLIGDVPNLSKRRRFFSSQAGVRFHQEFMKTNELPSVEFNVVQPGEIDDSVVFGLLQRSRSSGIDAFVLPQADELPMSNRREDLLFRRP